MDGISTTTHGIIQVTKVNRSGSFRFTCRDFSKLQKGGRGFICSPEFACAGYMWKLTVNAASKRDRRRFAEIIGDDIGVYLQLCAANVRLYVEAVFSLEKKGSSALCKEVKSYWDGSSSTGAKQFISNAEFFDVSNGFLVDDVAVFCAQIEVKHMISSELAETTETIQSSTVASRRRTLAPDLLQLLSSRSGADTVLIAGDKRHEVHRILLMARSPVFRAMFAHGELSEASRGEVNIVDVPSCAVAAMLHFIYADTVPTKDLKEIPDELLIAANKYGLEGLRSLCESYLEDTLALQNVAERLVIADARNCVGLKRLCLDLIKGHTAEAMASPGWQILAKHASLLNLVMSFIFGVSAPGQNASESNAAPQSKRRLREYNDDVPRLAKARAVES